MTRTVIAFRLNRHERKALETWIARTYGLDRPSLGEAARAIVMSRLRHDPTSESSPPEPKAPTGEEIVNARKLRGVTQSKLAVIFGASQTAVSMWESGAGRIPARLTSLVARWVETGEEPEPLEVARRKPRIVWQSLLDGQVTEDTARPQ